MIRNQLIINKLISDLKNNYKIIVILDDCLYYLSILPIANFMPIYTKVIFHLHIDPTFF